EALAREIVATGVRIGLPFVAATGAIGSASPPVGTDGRPLAETVFQWIDPGLRYWEDHGFALRAVGIHAARACAEPFWFRQGQLGSWRPNAALEAISAEGPYESHGAAACIVAPIHLPRGVIGVVIWGTPHADFDVEGAFAAHAGELHLLALKFVATYAESAAGSDQSPARLTRREIQCLKWAAAGKTDAEIAEIVAISLPTVRFHVANAARKLSAASRTQAVQRAAALGYIGAIRPTAASRPTRNRPRSE
ncbi:MAG TPA: helix-turn-helix transcriptional regulator, partial [Phenylobacterium sp.]|nr:helix-turn-helix transcriptional regulator [Phenylobacterium sp.]